MDSGVRGDRHRCSRRRDRVRLHFVPRFGEPTPRVDRHRRGNCAQQLGDALGRCALRSASSYDRSGAKEVRGAVVSQGIGVTLVGLGMQQSGWSLAEHFNHNDLDHVIQMAGLYCFYRGALALHEM